MYLEAALKATQIAFYVVATTIGIMTYIKAKRGLLNTISTEYHKKVIERLSEVSTDLFSEFDCFHNRYWARNDYFKKIVDDINSEFINYREEILKSGEFYGGIPVGDDELYISAMIYSIDSDPFIPKPIREAILRYLNKRREVEFVARLDELDEYKRSLAAGKYNNTLDHNHAWMHNKINRICYKEGVGVSQNMDQVKDIRIMIQSYFEEFIPK